MTIRNYPSENAHGRYEAAPYDHGFKVTTASVRRFDDLDEALIYCARHRHENGRVTNAAGRNQRDVTWKVRDLADTYHLPTTEHIKRAADDEFTDYLDRPCDVPTCFITATHRGVSKVDGARGSFCNEHTSWTHGAHALND